MPLAKRGILAGLVLSFARAVGEFGATLMLAGNIPGKTNTMSISIYSAFQAGNNELAQILVLVLILISLLAISLTGKIAHRKIRGISLSVKVEIKKCYNESENNGKKESRNPLR